MTSIDIMRRKELKFKLMRMSRTRELNELIPFSYPINQGGDYDYTVYILFCAFLYKQTALFKIFWVVVTNTLCGFFCKKRMSL